MADDKEEIAKDISLKDLENIAGGNEDGAINKGQGVCPRCGKITELFDASGAISSVSSSLCPECVSLVVGPRYTN